jgi:hypothetical protein
LLVEPGCWHSSLRPAFYHVLNKGRRTIKHMTMCQAQLCSVSQIARAVSARGYLKVREVGIDEIQIDWRRWIQRDKLTPRSPDINRTVDLRKRRLSPSTHTSKATASTVTATGRLRQRRLIADRSRLCSTTRLRQIEAQGPARGNTWGYV